MTIPSNTGSTVVLERAAWRTRLAPSVLLAPGVIHRILGSGE